MASCSICDDSPDPRLDCSRCGYKGHGSKVSRLPFTSVVSLHTNTYGCGVAKFSKALAERLGVPFVGLCDAKRGGHPLLSLKWSEFDSEMAAYLKLDLAHVRQSYSVFWHDVGDQSVLDNLTKKASVVFYADPSLGPNGLWCPSLLTPSKPRTVKLFSFGMAHKLQTAHYAKVRSLLDAAGLDYRLRVSVGLHEGTSLSDATKHFDALKAIMGADKVTILGILSDDAVAEELSNTEYVLAFFEQGLRANNTTVHAALDHRKVVITNHDDETPTFMAIMTRNVDDSWLGRQFDYSWDNLIRQMEGIYAYATNRQPVNR